MFSLTDSMRYWLYSEPCDMRKSFYTLSGLVTNQMHRDPLSGDVFIFINKSQTRMKILRMEAGGLVIYAKMLDIGRFHRPEPNSEGVVVRSCDDGRRNYRLQGATTSAVEKHIERAIKHRFYLQK